MTNCQERRYPILAFQEGDKLPVSPLKSMADGTSTGTTKYEKRGVAVDVPTWIPENCIQCNFCSMVCPHAVIRPVPMTDAELAAAAAGITKAATGQDRSPA